VDAQVNTIDTLGDEGELFSAIIRGINLSEAQLTRISTENDYRSIVINGQEIALEMAIGNTISDSITVVDNNISIDGTGSETGDFNIGVLFDNGSRSSTGKATITVTGQGSVSGANSNEGIRLNGANAKIISVDGAIELTGNGGGTTSLNRGVLLSTQSSISSTGNATIKVTGNGSTTATGEQNNGVALFTNSLITSNNGAIEIIGTGGKGTDLNSGVLLFNGSSISSTGNATIKVTGDGSTTATSQQNFGVFISGANSKIISNKGAIEITGTGGKGTNFNSGISLSDGGVISSTEDATITVTGKGSATATGNNNEGVRINGINSTTNVKSQITSKDGNIIVTATAGTATNVNNNFGIFLGTGGSIFSTGKATITVTATASSTATGIFNQGVRINGLSGGSEISSQSGDISITGKGGSGTSDNHGIILVNGSKISGNNTANITLTGTAGNGTNTDGIRLEGNNSKIQSASGKISLTGTATGSNFGINLLTGTSITSTSGEISLQGNTINLDNNSTITSSGEVYINSDSDGKSGITSLGATVNITANTLFLNDTIKVNYNGSNFDTLNLTGALNLNGSILDVDLTGYTATANNVLTLINNDSTDTVTGTFTGLAEGAKVGTSNSLDIFITYKGDATNPLISSIGKGNDVQLYAFSPLPIVTTGTSGSDTIQGGFGNNNIPGGSGNDSLVGLNFADTLDGGSNNDTLIGANGNDHLSGGSGNDRLLGDDGKDIINGGSGNDTLIGGVDVDTLTGGSNADFFLFNFPNEGIDTITDFKLNEDKIAIDALSFGGGLTSGVSLTSAQFRSGAGVTTADNDSQRFIYNTSTGALFFDVDGLGGNSAVQIAALSNRSSLNLNSFVLI
jgi:hypothetical protein